MCRNSEITSAALAMIVFLSVQGSLLAQEAVRIKRCQEILESPADLVGIVLFEEGSSNLDHEMSKLLRGIGPVLNSNGLGPANNLYIVGFTDRAGSASENVKLSEDRAHAVLQSLAGLLNGNPKLEAIGCGAIKPILANQGRVNPHNRRVEIRLD